MLTLEGFKIIFFYFISLLHNVNLQTEMIEDFSFFIKIYLVKSYTIDKNQCTFKPSKII